MLREDLSPSSSHATILLTPEHGTAFQRRTGDGNITRHSDGSQVEAPYWLRLERVGETVRGYASQDGETWGLIASDTVRMSSPVFVGLAVSSPERDTLATAMFSEFGIEEHETSDLRRAFEAPPRSRGLHFTQAELEAWRMRTRHGPYRATGDVGPHSPGDWLRILDNANSFLDNPEQAWWPTAQRTGGCIEPDFENPPLTGSDNMRDAAFVYLLVGGDVYRDAVKAALLRLVDNPELDLSDRKTWCNGRLADSSFLVAQWFLRNLFIYDYLGTESFTPTEQVAVEAWIKGAANFFLEEVEDSLDRLFVDRLNRDYRLTDVARAACNEVTHLGGHRICALQRYYNNRRASQIQFVGIAGIYFDEQGWIEAAKQNFREWLRFSVYPDGMMGEYGRWEPRLPDLGWAYAANIVATMITLAEHLARIGDTSLFEFRTDEGALGTEGGEKSLLLTIKMLGAHVDGSVTHFGTDQPRYNNDDRFLIDSVHEESGWRGLHDILVAHSNLYYQDRYIYEMYTRTGDSMPPYPEEPAQNGPRKVWSGDWGLYPGLLFMYGGLEGVVWPYDMAP